MPTLNDFKTVNKERFGFRVDRATDTLPQGIGGGGVEDNLFNVIGGRVAVTQIIGEVTVVVQTQANNTKLVANPTVGATTDMCAALDISALAVGVLIGITGLITDAMLASAGGLSAQGRDIIINPGLICLNCVASNTGSIKWALFYVPIDIGAYVTAAA